MVAAAAAAAEAHTHTFSRSRIGPSVLPLLPPSLLQPAAQKAPLALDCSAAAAAIFAFRLAICVEVQWEMGNCRRNCVCVRRRRRCFCCGCHSGRCSTDPTTRNLRTRHSRVICVRRFCLFVWHSMPAAVAAVAASAAAPGKQATASHTNRTHCGQTPLPLCLSVSLSLFWFSSFVVCGSQ